MHWLYYYFGDVDLSPIQDAGANAETIQSIINTVLAVMGAVAVLIIVIAGLRYITSQGSPNEVATARNAIVYSLVGLVVIITAFAIVNFVVMGLG